MRNLTVKAALLFAVVLLFFPALASAQNVRQLAKQPQAEVDENGVCHITGAIWEVGTSSRINRGPVRHARMVLRQVGTGQTYEAITDKHGVYRISIPVTKRTVFREEYAGRGIIRGSKPLAYCVKAKVNVGEVERVSWSLDLPALNNSLETLLLSVSENTSKTTMRSKHMNKTTSLLTEMATKYYVEASRQPISDEVYERIATLVPQDGFVSNGQYDEWLDDEGNT